MSRIFLFEVLNIVESGFFNSMFLIITGSYGLKTE